MKDLTEAAEYLSYQDFLCLKEQMFDRRSWFRVWVLAADEKF